MLIGMKETKKNINLCSQQQNESVAVFSQEKLKHFYLTTINENECDSYIFSSFGVAMKIFLFRLP